MNEMNGLLIFLGGAMISVGLGFVHGSIPVAVPWSPPSSWTRAHQHHQGAAMKPIKVEAEVNGKPLVFTMDDYGMWSLGPTGIEAQDATACGFIHHQQDRVALARFLGEVSRALATPKKSKPVLSMHNPKFDTELLLRSLS